MHPGDEYWLKAMGVFASWSFLVSAVDIAWSISPFMALVLTLAYRIFAVLVVTNLALGAYYYHDQADHA